ncbi:GGDEF domain-containing phosphodiesterase [Ferrimonas sp. YFM]|uniref:putative bifunctional diguanylate cyclase/phosphodiesterase n=1 Tax=Ferrimonas sp. YFM TaxID=3028878 RepID=UPI00257317DA|nr:GGDEF domain-containing phosphodiesterase [Ferrimonas sp. YFM]
MAQTGTPKLGSKHMAKWMFAAFLLVTAMLASMSWLSVKTGFMVQEDSREMVERHIPELETIGFLQRALSNRVNQLYLYYATTERDAYLSGSRFEDEKIDHSIDYLIKLGISRQDALALRATLTKLQLHANNFDREMARPDSDWDRLREHLSDAQAAAVEAQGQLDLWQANIRMVTMQDSESALTEVDRLAQLLSGFTIAIVVVSLFVLVALYSRLKDRDQLFRFAFYDSLTGLPNRRSLEEALQQTQQEGESGALVLLKLERYPLITGTYGHAFGGEVIQHIGKWIQEKLRLSPCDAILYRYNDDTWAVQLTCSNEPEHLKQLACSLSTMSDDPFCIGDRLLNLSVKIGITRYPQDGSDSDRLMRNADAAIHALVEPGRIYRFYDAELTARTQRWLATESALRNALRDDEFELFYQAKVTANGAQVAGAEALIRWRRNGELVSPGEFIPVAEQSGLIMPLGNWVLNEACRQLAQWQARGITTCPVAVNVSAQQFQDSGFPQLVAKTVARHRITPGLLELEITEEVAASDPQRVVDTMKELKASGVTIAMDDFGTGYSSLSYLKRLPIDTLKIDRAFVSNLDRIQDNAAIVDMILALAHQGGLKVVAEGVETEAEYQVLQDKQCDLVQGFLFSRPEPADQFTQKLCQTTKSDALQEA